MSYATPTPGAGAEFRVANVLNRAFEICTANFPFFFVITLVVALPSLWIEMNKPVAGQVPDPATFFPMLALAVVLGIVLNTIGEAVILYGAFQRLRGLPLQPGEAFQRAIARFLPLLGLGLLYALALVVGFMLFIVPGFILLVIWAVVVPACLVEGLGPIDSMSRSAALTKGYRWQIFGLMLIVGVISWIGSLVLGHVLAVAGPAVTAIGNFAWSAAWAVYWNCVLIMIYHDLRVAKEGIDTQQIASVFD